MSITEGRLAGTGQLAALHLHAAHSAAPTPSDAQLHTPFGVNEILANIEELSKRLAVYMHVRRGRVLVMLTDPHALVEIKVSGGYPRITSVEAASDMLSRNAAPCIMKTINRRGLGLLALVQALERKLTSLDLSKVAALLETSRRT